MERLLYVLQSALGFFGTLCKTVIPHTYLGSGAGCKVVTAFLMTFRVTHMFETLSYAVFTHLCSSWHYFNWHI